MTRPSIEDMAQEVKEDMAPYLVVALVPFQFLVDDEKLDTNESRIQAAKEFLDSLGLHGAKVESVEPIPRTTH